MIPPATRGPSGARLFFLTALLAIVPYGFAAAKEGPLPLPADGYDSRTGIAPGTDLEKLVGKPEMIEMVNFQFEDPATGEKRMAGFSDTHGVYDLPLEAFIQVIADYDSYHRFNNRIFESEVLKGSGDSWLVRYNVGISFLGFRVAYDTVEEATLKRFPDGSVLFLGRLVDSPDGNLFEHYTSTYLAEVLVNGKRMTYVRSLNRPGLRKPFPGMLAISKTFTPGESRAQMNGLAKEVSRRVKR